MSDYNYKVIGREPLLLYLDKEKRIQKIEYLNEKIDNKIDTNLEITFEYKYY